MKTIVFTDTAARDLLALPAAHQLAIEDALQRYAIGGVGDVKRLQGSEFFRLRVGRYRVIFDEDSATILAVYVGKRETTTYRRLPSRKGP